MKSKKLILILVLIISVLIISTIILTNKDKHFIKISYEQIQDKIEKKEDFILCISATNCSHCKDYKPKLKKIAKNYDIVIYYINTDDLTEEKYEEFKKTLNFDGGTPTTIFFKNGEEKTTATRIIGNVKTEKIINKIKIMVL